MSGLFPLVETGFSASYWSEAASGDRSILEAFMREPSAQNALNFLKKMAINLSELTFEDSKAQLLEFFSRLPSPKPVPEDFENFHMVLLGELKSAYETVHNGDLSLFAQSGLTASYVSVVDPSHLSIDALKDEAFNAIKKTSSEISQMKNFGKPITWLTGTNSYTLIGMYEVTQKIAGMRSFALVPTGILLNHDIVPLAGELGGGIGAKGINEKRLSGVYASSYAGAFMYAREKKFHFNPKEAEAKLSKELDELDIYLRDADPILQMNKLKIELLRVLVHTGISNENIESLKVLILGKIEKSSQPPEKKEQLQSAFLRLFQNARPLALPRPLEDIKSIPPFPIAFASTHLSDEELASAGSSISQEALYKGILELGNQIDVIITEKEKIDLVRSILGPFDVDVISFETAEVALKQFPSI